MKPMKNPPHPGEYIKETIEGLRADGKSITLTQLADGLQTSRKNLSLLIHKKQSISPIMALKLAAAFRNTTPEFWLQAQEKYDLAAARPLVDTSNITVFWQPEDLASWTVPKLLWQNPSHFASLKQYLF